ncbi:fatty acid desaturase-domain-containing protein, partial [Pavlovales sp. CCMP2436]
RMIPESAFKIDTMTSVGYLILDGAAVVVSLFGLHALLHSVFWLGLPLAAKAVTVAPLQLLAGFAMWTMWCIGHDAGHGTFSKSKLVNDIAGEISHSVCCLTPFHAWKLSHLQHHLNHNHISRDYSHQWFIKGQPFEPAWLEVAHATRNVQIPFFYIVYLLLGVPDGGHVFFYGKMWEGLPASDKQRGVISSAVSLATALGLWAALGTAEFGMVCIVPWLVMSCWLFMVTYLQHHSEDGKIYTDETWSFTRGGFETVDRDYGTLFNNLCHHMMDGHVAHHLFFSKIPHYGLKPATDGITAGLDKLGLKQALYKSITTHDFVQEVVTQFDRNWFFVEEANVVRE